MNAQDALEGLSDKADVLVHARAPGRHGKTAQVVRDALADGRVLEGRPIEAQPRPARRRQTTRRDPADFNDGSKVVAPPEGQNDLAVHEGPGDVAQPRLRDRDIIQPSPHASVG